MKNTLKITLAVAAALALVGCATKPQTAVPTTTTTTTANASSSNSAGVAPATGLSASQALQQTLAALPSTVYFAFDKYTLSSDAIAILQQNSSVLLQNPQVNVMLAGNTDPLGSQEYNFHLGMKRAQAVYNYFLQQGIPASQLCMVSYGELKPSAQVDQSAVTAARGSVKALITAYAPDRRSDISYNQTCQGANSSANTMSAN